MVNDKRIKSTKKHEDQDDSSSDDNDGSCDGSVQDNEIIDTESIEYKQLLN